jgi:hypothetical protein
MPLSLLSASAMSDDAIQPTARDRLAAAHVARAMAQDEHSLAEADAEVGRALAAAFLAEYPSIRARYDALAAEAQELHSESRCAQEKGLPMDPIEFAAFAARGLAWMQRWRIFITELAAIAATKH